MCQGGRRVHDYSPTEQAMVPRQVLCRAHCQKRVRKGCVIVQSSTWKTLVAGWMVLEPGRLFLLLGRLAGPPSKSASCRVVLRGFSSLACMPVLPLSSFSSASLFLRCLKFKPFQ